MAYKAKVEVRYAGVNYNAGDVIPDVSERDAKILMVIGKIEAGEEAKPEPASAVLEEAKEGADAPVKRGPGRPPKYQTRELKAED
ncbi:MAG: hypothetical protein ACRCU5_07035 [Rhizobiaceae bacterium]